MEMYFFFLLKITIEPEQMNLLPLSLWGENIMFSQFLGLHELYTLILILSSWYFYFYS